MSSQYPVLDLHINTKYIVTLARRVVSKTFFITPQEFVGGIGVIRDEPPVKLTSKHSEFYLANRLSSFVNGHGSIDFQVNIPTELPGVYGKTIATLDMPIDTMVDLFEHNYLIATIRDGECILEFAPINDPVNRE